MAIMSWIENPERAIANGKLCTYTEFMDLTSRKNGFSSGDVISSKEVNSALRQANMVATALCYAVGAGGSFSLESNSGELRDYFEHYFGAVVENVSYNTSTRTLTVKFKDGRVKNLKLGDLPSQVESAIKDGDGNVITQTYATNANLAGYATLGQLDSYLTKTEANTVYASKTYTNDLVNSQASWCDEYDSGYPGLNELTADGWGDYSSGSIDGNENQIVPNTHGVADADNIIISIDKSATKAQCEAFYDALIVPVSQEDGLITIKALGDIPTIDIPVTVMKV